MRAKRSLGLSSLLSAISLVLFSAAAATGQISAIPPSASDTGMGGNNSIVGTILGPSGKPISGRVRIRLSSMTRGDRITNSDSNGNFAFRGVPAGTYTIAIDKEKDFEPYAQDLDIVQLRGAPGGLFTVNIRLVAKAPTDAKPEVVKAQFAGVPQKALDLYNKAVELATAGDNLGAIEQLKLATAEYPKFMQAFNQLGVLYLKSNLLEDANAALESAQMIDPEAFPPMLNRGIVMVTMKRFGEAVPVLRKALKVNEKSAPAHFFCGQALANLGLFDEAEKNLSTAVKLGGNEMKEAHRILAIIYGSKGDKKRAAAEIETYLRLAPDAPDAEQLRTTAQKMKGESDPGTEPAKRP